MPAGSAEEANPLLKFEPLADAVEERGEPEPWFIIKNSAFDFGVIRK